MSLKIALIDLTHMTVGVHNNSVPLGIGFIGYYLRNKLKNNNIDVKLFKNPNMFLDAMKYWVPDVIGISQYSWNSRLNLHMAGIAKNKNANCVVVAGGPDLYLTPPEKFTYLKQFDIVDICVSYDGEIPFSIVVERLINGENIKDIRNYPVPGTYCLDCTGEKLMEPNVAPPRFDSLELFGSMYAEGFFDEFLAEGFSPFVQTQRGCPFECAYCHNSNDYYSKVVFQSIDNFRKDIEYLGKRFSGQHNVQLYIADPNFGLFKNDFEIACAIRDTQDNYDWPKVIEVNLTKNPKKHLQLISILKYITIPGISIQTLTPKVLKNIKRKNPSYGEFIAFQEKVVKEYDERSITELILSLPDETKDSFTETVAKILNSGVQNITIYTLMNLKGTPINSPQMTSKYGHLIMHRIVPRSFSEINGIKIFDTEEVIVSTKSMPFDDYLYLRGLSLVIAIFASTTELYPLRKLIKERGLDIAKWIFNIHDNICFSELSDVYNNFINETKQELFSTYKELVDFFCRKENYELLCKGQYGDNLLRKYRTIVLSRYYNECLHIAFDELRRQSEYLIELPDSLIKDLETYLKSRTVTDIFKKYNTKKTEQKVILSWNIPTWLRLDKSNEPLESYRGSFKYSVRLNDYVLDRLVDFQSSHQNHELALQNYYRDGHIKDFWPIWVKSE